MAAAKGTAGAGGESAAEEKSAAEEEADFEEDADTDFGQPRVTTTSVVPEAERRAAAAAAELVEQQHAATLQRFRGCASSAGDKLIFRHDGGTAVVGHKGFVAAAGWKGEERAFGTSTGCVVQADWHPSYGRRVVVAGSALAEGAGWLVAEDGERISGPGCGQWRQSILPRSSK